MKKKNWELVGNIGVDAGLCWIGDPCYCVTPDSSEHPAKTWQEFCQILFAKEEVHPTGNCAQWQYKAGHDGLGVTVETGWGDGFYPVYVRRSNGGRIAEVRVVFIDTNNKVLNKTMEFLLNK